MANEYEPWVETAETELEYFKRLYLGRGAEIHRLRLCEKSLVAHTAAWLRHFGLEGVAASLEANRTPLEQAIAQVITQCLTH